MKRLRIWIDHDIDAKLEEDPLWKMAGAASFDPVPPEKIDDVVYGQPEA